MRKRIINAAPWALVPVVIILVILYCLLSGGEKDFERIDIENFSVEGKYFRVDERLRKIFLKKRHLPAAREETGSPAPDRAEKEASKKKKDEIWLNDLPTINGYPLYISGKKMVKIVPGMTGEVGFYTYLFFDNFQKEAKIQFMFEINRDGKSLKIDHITAARSSHPYFQHLTLEKNDILVFKFKGNGIAFFSKPIVYKKNPVEKRKNIFLIAVDTLRWDQVGAVVGGKPLTPHIDAFTRDCLIFDNAYAQCSWTLPSFMSLFTGLYEFNHKVDIARALDPGIPTLTEKAAEKFITFGFHSGMGMRKRWGYSRGFDYYKRVPYTTPLFPKAGQSLFRSALRLLEEANFPDFFFFLHTYQVHDPYTPPLEFLLKLNENPAYKRLDVVNQNAPWKTFLPVEDDLRKSLEELYRAEIHAFDSYFGEFVEKLKEWGLYDNAMIVFMADHGEEFYEHQGWAHSHSLYNELIKVPLMIKFPNNGFKGMQVNDAAGIIDLIPTILGYYGVGDAASGTDGIDLMPLIRGNKNERGREYVLSSVSESRYIREIPPKFAILYKDYKIIYNEPFSSKDLDYFRPYGLPPEVPRIEVYDLNKDIEEKHNIARQKPDLIKKVMPLIKKIRKIIKDNMLESKKKGSELDEEAKKQLKSLGYIDP